MPPGKPKILLVEDDRYLSKIYSNKLRLNGFDVSLATTGEEGLHKAATERPDLILLDLILPGKDGFQVLEELKTDRTTQKIPVVILSNLGQEADIERGMNLGARSYLIKANLSLSQIVDTARQYMGAKAKPAPAKIICPKCGEMNPAGSKFCSNCGTKLA